MPSALVVGGASWDTIVQLERFPEPRSQTVFSRACAEALGGTGAGKALNLRRLGFEVTLHALLGDDGPGERVRGGLAREGIALLAEVDPKGTERHLNLMDAQGGRISIYVAYATFEPAIDLARLEALVPAHDHVVVNVINYARRLLPALRRAGRSVWCDVHDWDGRDPYHRDFVEAADHLFLSSDQLPGWRRFMEEQVAAGKRLVVCTHGHEGSTALTADGRWIETPIAPGFELRDSNGAGDAFFSGVLWARARGLDHPQALRAGTLTAGLCIAAEGLYHPQLDPARLAEEYRRVYREELDERPRPLG